MNDGKPLNPLPHGERRRAGDEPARARAKTDGWDARNNNWLDRGAAKPGGRHTAITRNLYSWSGYKSWADKVRNTWDRDKK